jgi:hypothetical protein
MSYINIIKMINNNSKNSENTRSRTQKIINYANRKLPEKVKRGVIPHNIVKMVSKRNISKRLNKGRISEGCDICVADTKTYNKSYQLVRNNTIENKNIKKLQKEKKKKMDRCQCEYLRKIMLSRLKKHIKRCKKSQKCKNKKFGRLSFFTGSKRGCKRATKRCEKRREAYNRLMQETEFGKEILDYYRNK